MDEEDEPASLAGPDELVPCLACCCIIGSLYADWPECIGARVKTECCCLRAEGLFCKPACNFCGEINPHLKKNPRTMCVGCEGSYLCVSPESLGGGTCQYFCADFRCALPPGGVDSETPCVLALLGLTCCFGYKCKMGCCSKLGALKAAIKDAGAPVDGAIYDTTPRGHGQVPVAEIVATPIAAKMEARE